MFLRFVAVALTLAAPAYSQTFPEPQSDTVSDFAEVLDATEEGRITRLLTETRDATGVQMAVVTVPGIGTQGGAGMRIEDYGKALFNAPEVGCAACHNGPLFTDMKLRDVGTRGERDTDAWETIAHGYLRARIMRSRFTLRNSSGPW